MSQLRGQNAGMRYAAFISYSHADEKSARWLMHRLESYRVPKYLIGSEGSRGAIPARLGQVFRDRDELPSAGDLNSTITAALAASRSLVVICSPASAGSRWVNAEVREFRRQHGSQNIFSFVIDGDPSSREPGVASFPNALLEPDAAGAPEREPLAADARREGDGKQRAFLKLMAGLLGVGYDSLAQREAQKRQRSMAIITIASLAGMALACSLALTAYIARKDAERRQEQAEDILGFMLGDLRENLTTVGRLDLMRSVHDKAAQYFATLDPRDLSDRALEEQARSLTGIGEVRLSEGDHDAAMSAFREAHGRTTALYERAPANGQRLYDLAQAQFWIGFVATQQGRLEDAEPWLIMYRDSTVRLAAMDPSNFSWQREAAYGHHNLAVLDERLGRYDSAQRSMEAERELYVRWLEDTPENHELRFEYANVVSWLGSLALNQGKLLQAEVHFIEQDRAIQRNVVEDAGTAKWKAVRVDALLLLLDVQVQLGKYEAARDTNASALELARELASLDPSNNAWRWSHGIATYWDALLATDNRIERMDDAVSILREANTIEPEDEYNARWLARSLQHRGMLHLREDDTENALAMMRQAKGLIEPFWLVSAQEKSRLAMAHTLILEGEILAVRGDPDLARASWEQALQLLSEHAGDELPFARLGALVRVMHLLGRADQATAHRSRLQASGFVLLRPLP